MDREGAAVRRTGSADPCDAGPELIPIFGFWAYGSVMKPRQDRPVGPIAGFHAPETDGLTLREFTVLLMAHAHRMHSHNEEASQMATDAIADADAIMAAMGLDS